MHALSRIVGGYLVAVAMLVGIFAAVEPLFHTSTEQFPYSPWWENINPLTGVAVALGVVFGGLRKRAVEEGMEDDALNWPRLSANVLFYGLLCVALLYYWNWFGTLNPDYAPGQKALGITWKITDVAFPVLAGTLGLSMLRGGAPGSTGPAPSARG